LSGSPSGGLFGAGAGPGDEPPEGQGRLGRVAEPLGDHGWPEGQDWGAVDANRELASGRGGIAPRRSGYRRFGWKLCENVAADF